MLQNAGVIIPRLTRNAEIENMKRDLASMSEKLVDEIDKRAELQAAKDSLQEELEELTKSLFEEANSMVHFHYLTLIIDIL